ncbi:hypothetical protein V5O48_013941 [Marasmius crinis-equi]|uniref:HMG box domain-containing protein n=1 Tax=Marasmius crinis-equi TaxID=585013 RepID=A0ABR3EYQ5_9AGAR
MPPHRGRSSHTDCFPKDPSGNRLDTSGLPASSLRSRSDSHLRELCSPSFNDQSSNSPENFAKEFGLHSGGDQTSMYAASAWTSLTSEQKKPYRDHARTLREKYKRRYPDFGYHKGLENDSPWRVGQGASTSSPSHLSAKEDGRLEALSPPTATGDYHGVSPSFPSDIPNNIDFPWNDACFLYDPRFLPPSLYNASGGLSGTTEAEVIHPLDTSHGIARGQQIFGLKPQIYPLDAQPSSPLADSEQPDPAPSDPTDGPDFSLNDLTLPGEPPISESGVEAIGLHFHPVELHYSQLLHQDEFLHRLIGFRSDEDNQCYHLESTSRSDSDVLNPLTQGDSTTMDSECMSAAEFDAALLEAWLSLTHDI